MDTLQFPNLAEFRDTAEPLRESEIQPRNLIAVEGNSALFLRPIKQPRDKSTEQAMKAAISAKLKP